MCFFMLLLVSLNPMIQSDEWTPPKNPDPQAILGEARGDAMALQYKTSLAKHVWFHENVLKIDPSYYGVRLSFAISHWVELGKKYPPALTKLKAIRDEATKKVIADKDIRELFHDMESINQHLDEHHKTVETFKTLDEKQPKKAEKVFDLAQAALVIGKEYKICGKYISFENALSNVVQEFQSGKKMVADGLVGASHLDYVNKKFTSDATLLVAILSVNDRKDEAKDFAESVRSELEDKEFHQALENSLKGVVPAPWP